MNPRFRLIDTVAGHVGIVATARGLRRLFLPRRAPAALKREILAHYPDAAEDQWLMPELVSALRRYFAGEPVALVARLDWSGHNPFDVDVWRSCQRLPYGQTTSYKSLAERLGRPGAARAVGTAMGRNPFPLVVPCHRVVKSDGSLGGYSGPGGVGLKRRLLDMEAAACR